MRSSKYPISRLHNIVEFGKEGPTGEINPNTGEEETGFVPKTKVHCGTYTLSTSATISLAGAALNNTIALVVRHTNELTDLKKYPEARYKGELYGVTGWSIDDQLNAYDVVTLKKTDKH